MKFEKWLREGWTLEEAKILIENGWQDPKLAKEWAEVFGFELMHEVIPNFPPELFDVKHALVEFLLNQGFENKQEIDLWLNSPWKENLLRAIAFRQAGFKDPLTALNWSLVIDNAEIAFELYEKNIPLHLAKRAERVRDHIKEWMDAGWALEVILQNTDWMFYFKDPYLAKELYNIGWRDAQKAALYYEAGWKDMKKALEWHKVWRNVKVRDRNLPKIALSMEHKHPYEALVDFLSSLGFKRKDYETWIFGNYSEKFDDIYVLASYYREGFNIKVASIWQEYFKDAKDAKPWYKKKWQPDKAKDWHEQGFTETQAREWSVLSPKEAKRWKEEGFTVSEAVHYKLVKKLDPQKAKLLKLAIAHE